MLRCKQLPPPFADNNLNSDRVIAMYDANIAWAYNRHVDKVHCNTSFTHGAAAGDISL